jgi:hypothetical protein
MDWERYLASLGGEDAPNPFHDKKVHDFTSRIGLTALPGLDATDGVKADWRHLSAALTPEVKGMRLEREQVGAIEPGLAECDFTWRRRERRVSVAIFVSGVGSRGARDKLVQLATETTTIDVPLVLGPAGLGDLAVQYMDPPYENVIWVFQNVCIEIDNDETGVEILPIARRIQSVMKAHVVPDIARYVPKVLGVDISPQSVRVGEPLTLTVRLAEGFKRDELDIEIHQIRGPSLEWNTHDAFTVTVTAEEPGRVEFQILVVDPKTLLSPKVGVFVDVLPAH